MAKKKNRKIVKYRKPFHLNIGVIVFVLIFLYVMYNMFVFFTTKHISVYEVSQGTIAQDTFFQGIVLRDETVYHTNDSGYINYYCKNGSKVGTGTYIFSIDETGDYYSRMAAANDGKLLSDESYQELANVAEQYLNGYSDVNFRQVYQFKYDIEGTMVEELNSSAQLGADALASGTGLHTYTSETDGIVVYHTDGLEGLTLDGLTRENFDNPAYEKENFLKRQTVSAGDAAYKIVNSEIWQVVIPIDEVLAQDLAETENIKVSFKKDNSTVWAASSLLNKEDGAYLVLEFNNSAIRFVDDRYLELELLLTDTTGLKIPNTAITEKDFISIPKEYITKGGDSDSNGILLVKTNKEGEESVVFTKATLFYETDTSYYISAEDVKLGDVVVLPESSERYTLKESGTLEGVYNINKGYAVFRRIEKLFENEEYTIVESGTSNGISMYDHIALDSSAVSENDLVH